MLFKKKIHSEIILAEKQENTVRKGNEATHYLPVYIRTKEKHIYALFTETEINKAIRRAERNPEDKKYEHQEYWLARLLKFILW